MDNHWVSQDQIKKILIDGTTHVAIKGPRRDVIIVNAAEHPEILFEIIIDFDKWKGFSIC